MDKRWKEAGLAICCILIAIIGITFMGILFADFLYSAEKNVTKFLIIFTAGGIGYVLICLLFGINTKPRKKS